MAGLAGIFNPAGLEPETAGDLLGRMAGALTYVANDTTDRWQDGRLAIVRVHHGLVDQEAQPHFNEDSSILAWMYGEVLGFKAGCQELAGIGHRFHNDNSGPEYCLHLYEQQGDLAFNELNSSFSLVIYRRDSGELLLASDRFSTRPLYYYYDGRNLLFASQVRPLLCFPGLPRALDMQSVYDFFSFQRVLGSRTHLKGIRVLPPAHVLQLRSGTLQLRKYYTFPCPDETRSGGYYTGRLAGAFRKALDLMAGGDRRTALLLSGGLDSRMALAAAGRGRIPLSYTVADFDNLEVDTARRIAQAAGSRHIFFPRSKDHYLRLVEQAVDIGDGMYRIDHAHNLGFLEEMGSGADVLLHCFAFDVLFKALRLPLRPMQVLGRMYHWPRLDVPPDLTRARSLAMISGVSAMQQALPLFRAGPDEISRSIDMSLDHELDIEDADTSISEAEKLIRYFMWGAAYKFPAWLFVLHQRAYLEERTVAFDNGLIDLAYRIPAGLKAGHALMKDVLLRLSPRLACITNVNTGYPASMPAWVELALQVGAGALRQKSRPPATLPEPYFTQGSWPDLGALVRANTGFQALLRDTIEDEACLSGDVFRREALRQALDNHMAGAADNSRTLFLLLTFGRWFKKYGPR